VNLHDAADDLAIGKHIVIVVIPLARRPARGGALEALAQIRRSVTEPGRLLPCRSTPYSSLPWTAGEPRQDEGAHEVVVAVKAFIGPE
jgi:hypothetical protein